MGLYVGLKYINRYYTRYKIRSNILPVEGTSGLYNLILVRELQSDSPMAYMSHFDTQSLCIRKSRFRRNLPRLLGVRMKIPKRSTTQDPMNHRTHNERL